MLRLGDRCSRSSSVLQQHWEAIVLHPAICVPHQGVNSIRVSRCGPELRFQVRVIVIDQLRGEQTEARDGSVHLADGRDGGDAHGIEGVLVHDVERPDVGAVRQRGIGHPVLVRDRRTVERRLVCLSLTSDRSRVLLGRGL